MEETFVNATKDDQGNEDSPIGLKKDGGLVENNSSEFTESKSKGSVDGKSKETLTSDFKQSYIGESCIQESSLHSQQVTDVTKLKSIHFGCLNEKHLRQHYLDLVKVRPSDSLNIACSPSYPGNIAVKLRSSKTEILFDSLKKSKSRRRNTCDLGSFSIDYPSAAGQGKLVISPVRQLIVGAVSGNDNLRSILKSPLISHLGSLGDDKKSKKARSTNLKGEKCSQIMSSPEVLSIISSLKLEKEAVTLENQQIGQQKVYKRLLSISSTSSSCSDLSSSSTCAPVSQGMLHCTWKGGIPYFMFFVDDQKEVYAANLWKVESSNNKSLDYMYSFHLRTDEQMSLGTSDNVLDLVGKMKVSSSYILCPNSSKLMETEFILFGTNESYPSEMQSLTPTAKKNRRFSKKVLDAFRKTHPSKYKSRPKGVPSSIYEDLSGEQCQEMLGELDAMDSTLLESDPSPNLELAAIVVKDYVRDTCQEAVVGGWGLKFLEKVGAEKANTPVEDFDSPESSQESPHRNRNDCSTSMDVLIPAGFHGGPRTRNGGPSSLTARWRSGGHCDCGGWDIGCPLTVLHNMSSKEIVMQADAQQECKSFDLFMEGTNHGEPTLRMVNIQDGMYFIHFQSTLTALQAFSIGVATIHTQSSALCPKNVEKLKQQESRFTIL
ncbi:uncharacterized protein LOC122073074 [Macadamia integrifolia]|uniref:uncharacterized protein LOC122073074 n=1 Tax=Macadamia integrifolia TaxID=60698 RepID=UPI001C4FEF0E|nr:uncharacterized protein LOC122073074 [Macadamia integrifolia]XP_042493522.1 uncharacterized protein LOC122073074 [Macadamia integrifolia]